MDRIESGTTTRRVLEDSEKRKFVGRGVLFTNTAVVQIKLDPER
jgi:hypothetical protein